MTMLLRCSSCDKQAAPVGDWLTCAKYVACSRVCADAMDAATKTSHEWEHVRARAVPPTETSAATEVLLTQTTAATELDLDEETKPAAKSKRSRR